MKIKFRKLNFAIHRDLGFFFFGMCIVYGISGIAMNHLKDWNPNYIINNQTKTLNITEQQSDFSKEKVLDILKSFSEEGNFKNYYFPEKNNLKIFIKNGTVSYNIQTGEASMETIRRRPIFGQTAFLHYNPGKLWTYFSDIFAVSLILIAVSGLFIIRNKKGIKGRGAILLAIGIIIPVVLFLMYM